MIFALISVASGNLAFTGANETSEYSSFVPTAAANPRGLLAGSVFMIPAICVALLAIVLIGVFLVQDDEEAEPVKIKHGNKKVRVPRVGLNDQIKAKQDAALSQVDNLMNKKNTINRKGLELSQEDDKLALEAKMMREEDRQKAMLLEGALADEMLNVQDAQDDLENVVGMAEDHVAAQQYDQGFGQAQPPVVVVQQPPPMHIPPPQQQVGGQRQQHAGQW
jgi:hypothetical protein